MERFSYRVVYGDQPSDFRIVVAATFAEAEEKFLAYTRRNYSSNTKIKSMELIDTAEVIY